MSEPLPIACPHCHALNRVPAQRLAEGPACGRCHRALFDGKPVALGVDNFDAHYLRSDVPLLVDFWAPWCGPCRVMAPQFEQAAAVLEPQVRMAKVDTQEQPTLGQKFGVRSIPTLALFHQGREVARQAGAMPAATIVDWVRRHLG
jgi:thioredoxin 2